MQIKPPLSNLQLELLKVFSRHVPDEDLQEIRAMLSNYFAKKATQLADEVWDQDALTEEKMDEWRQTHLRTDYKIRQKGDIRS